MKHIRLFKTNADFESATLDLPNLSYVEETDAILCKPFIDYSKQYFTIEALEDGLTASLSGENDLEYCVDGGEWKALPASTYTESINTGQTLSFKGFIEPFGPMGPPKTSGQFIVEKRCNLKGNIMSLLFGDDFTDKTDMTNKTLRAMFVSTAVVDASNLILPGIILSYSCYNQMFQNNNFIEKAPELPATTIEQNCYSQMFCGCSNLIQAPKVLPANKVLYSSYNNMFYGCTSLTKAPEILATEIYGPYCFQYMFANCTNLIKGPSSISIKTFYPEQGSPPPSVCSSMFKNCINLTESPILVADWIGPYCYESMFEGCSKLNKITMLATTIGYENSLTNWVSGVSSTGEFIKHPDMHDLPVGSSGIPKGWIVDGQPYIDYSQEYFTIESLEDDNEIKFKIYYGDPTLGNKISYQLGGSDSWSTLTYDQTLVLNKNQTAKFKMNNPKIVALTYGPGTMGIGTFYVSKKYNVKGNIMSLLHGDDFVDKVSLSGKAGVFKYLFRPYSYVNPLIDASNLILPATTLAGSCYHYMFQQNTLLTSAPKLPATTLDGSCYQYMFSGCTSLTTAPELPATTLTAGCYLSMFHGCNSLNYIKMLATDVSANSCLTNWVKGVSSTGTFIKNSNATWDVTGVDGIPEGWTVQNA